MPTQRAYWSLSTVVPCALPCSKKLLCQLPLWSLSPPTCPPQVLIFAMLISCPPAPEESRLRSPSDFPPSSLYRSGICPLRKLLWIREHLKMNIFYPSQPAQPVLLQIAEGCVIDSDSGRIGHPAWIQGLWPHPLFFVVILGLQLALCTG